MTRLAYVQCTESDGCHCYDENDIELLASCSDQSIPIEAVKNGEVTYQTTYSETEAICDKEKTVCKFWKYRKYLV